MKKNRYWEDYKRKYSDKWHFDPLKKNTKDYTFIGNIRANYKTLLKEISKIEKKKNYFCSC